MCLLVKNWAEFQHYKNRQPPWLKLHRGLLDDFDWHRLPDASKALAPMLWLLASEHEGGVIVSTVEEIAFRLRTLPEKVDAALKPLIDSGFFIEVPGDPLPASAPLAQCQQGACSEREGETEEEREARARGASKPLASDRSPPPISIAQLLADGWQPSADDIAWAATARPDLTPAMIDSQTERFRLHQRVKNYTSHDWSASWRGWIMKSAAADVLAKQGPAAPSAPSRAPLQLTGAQSRWTFRLMGHRPGEPWPAANGPPPESDDDNPLLDDDQRRQWRRYHGLAVEWRKPVTA